MLSGKSDWWTELGDAAIDRLVGVSLASNPTLAEALARIDQASAQLAGDRAARLPSIVLSAGVSRAKIATPAGTQRSTTATIGPRLSWEIDLWGRLREQAGAARHRLDARNADAANARLSVAAQIGDAVVVLRGCQLSLSIPSYEP
jgi:outer membrane protein TolC